MTLPPREFLRGLLESEEGQADIKRLWKEATKRRRKKKSFWVTCGHCNHRVLAEYEVDATNVKDALAFANFAATYGVGKPPEEKTVNVNVTARKYEDMTTEELNAIIEGTARELPPGSH